MYTIQELSRLEELMRGQSEVLQLITRGKPLQTVLDKLIDSIEAHSEDGLIASILCTDSSGMHLYHCAGRSLPQEYIDGINGIKIGPSVGSCGTAAYTQQPVFVESINDSPLWKNFKHLALKHDLHSCWSIPLINNEGIVRGTFAIYYNVPKLPQEKDQQLINLVAHTALIAIEHHHAEEERKKTVEREKKIIENIRKSEERFQNLVREATVGIVVLRGEDMIVDVVNEMYGKLISRTPEQLLNKPLFSVIPDAEETFKPLLDNVRITGEPLNLYDQPYYVVVDGKDIDGYLNIVYQPFREADGTITGVMALCHDVSEVVASRKKLEQSEEQFRSLVMQAPVAIAVFRGRDLKAEIVNDSYLPLVGRTREDFENKPLLQSLPEVKEVLDPMVKEIFETGNTLFLNEFPVTLNRNEKPEKCFFNAIWKPLFDLHGNVDGFIAVANEVTSQVEARRKVEESVQQVRSFVESAPFPIGVYVGREMRIQFANQSIKDVWGKGNDVEGKLYAEVLPELADQNIYQQLDDVFTSGNAFHAKHQRVDLVVDGVLQPFYFNYSFTPLHDSKGEVYGVMNTAAEVTELVMAYKGLEESESRARLAIEASGQGTFDIDLKTNLVKGSLRLAEIFDVESDADRDRYVSTIHPDDLHIREEAYRKAYESGILNYEGRVVKKNGFITWIRVKGKIYFNEQNQPERLVGIVQDITEQKNFSDALSEKVKERTEELQFANQQLQAMNDELQQFAYVSSHDLQEPLRKIKMFSDMVSKTVSGNLEAERHLSKIFSAAERMSGLIQSLLEYSRVANSMMRFEKINLNRLLTTIINDYDLLIEQKQAIIQIDPLPTIEGVSLHLNQLFFNLIGNALKFTRRGVQPHIRITTEPVNDTLLIQFPELQPGKDYVLISVQDNGIGFEQSFAGKIFTVFQRLNDRSVYGGFGIGLALCKKVAMQHNGVIFAEGVPNKGAKFSIILPLLQS